MTYVSRTSRTSPNYTSAANCPQVYGMSRLVEAITIHHWGDLGQKFDNVENELCNPNVQKSAHYIVQDNLVSCIVDPDDVAWHSGNPVGNARTVGIECRPEATEGDYRTVAELIRDLREVYGNVPLRPHNYWTATSCPGNWDLAKLDRMARSLGPSKPTKPVVKPPVVVPPVVVKPKPIVNDPNRIGWIAEKGDTFASISKYYGGPTAQAIAAFNGVALSAAVQVGRKYYIPGPLAWIVDPGDTLTKIAAYYGLSAQVVANNNGLKLNSVIQPGQVIRILN